jgi:hypothetical protein
VQAVWARYASGSGELRGDVRHEPRVARLRGTETGPSACVGVCGVLAAWRMRRAAVHACVLLALGPTFQFVLGERTFEIV